MNGFLTSAQNKRVSPKNATLNGFTNRQMIIKNFNKLAGIEDNSHRLETQVDIESSPKNFVSLVENRPKSMATSYDPFNTQPPMTGVTKRYNPRMNIDSVKTFNYVGPTSTSKEKILKLRA